jgi:alkylation response protein AidB-like acyl-CoA dehydrogenase
MSAAAQSPLVAAARDLRPQIQECAAAIDAERMLPPDLVDALRVAGLFHLTVPRELGGQQADPLTLGAVIEEIAAADGSAGWCIMIASQNAAFSGFMERATAETVFATGGIMAGVARPIGRAVPGPGGGFTVSGRWPFASGSSHAAWFAAECLVYDGDGASPRKDESGNHISYMAFVPRDQVTIHDTWHTLGLRGTASHDFSIDRAEVPAAFGMKMFPEPWHPWPFYRTLALMFTTHGAHALGIARAAVDTTIDIAKTKIGWGTDKPIAEGTRMQHTIADAFVTVAAGREHMYGAANRLWEAAERGEDLGKLNGRVRLATSYAATSSLRAVELVYASMATSAIFTKSPLDRQFRDMRTAAAHVMVGPLTYEAAGRVELGLPAGMAFFD